MKSDLEFLETARFRLSYERYNGERAKIRSKVSELRSKANAEPITWLRNLERLRDPDLEIYRIKITEGDRLIFCIFESRVVLLEVGPHEIMEDFLSLKSSEKKAVLRNMKSIPEWFASNSEKSQSQILDTSINGGDEMRWLYEEELNESWIQFLDEEQWKVRNGIFQRVSTPGTFEFHLILGGAGTGKTVVLLNLALSLKEKGRNVVSRFSPQVLKYLNSGAQRVPGSSLDIQPGSVVLIDDPSELNDLKKIIKECNQVGARALVAVLDPFQWIERRVYEKFNELLETFEPFEHKLSVCYRQSANVGSKALEYTSIVLDKTSPFILDSKIEEHKKSLDPLKDICIDQIEFVDDGGRFRLYDNQINKNFLSEVERLRQRMDLWKHWHPLLIVSEEEFFPLPADWKNSLKGINSIVKSVDDVVSIRGCEYQEVFLNISESTWKLITNGVLGATSADWRKAISFHTLMTRPKDSLVIFVSNPNS